MHIHKFQIYSNLDFQTAVAKWQDVSLKLSWEKTSASTWYCEIKS